MDDIMGKVRSRSTLYLRGSREVEWDRGESGLQIMCAFQYLLYCIYCLDTVKR